MNHLNINLIVVQLSHRVDLFVYRFSLRYFLGFCGYRAVRRLQICFNTSGYDVRARGMSRENHIVKNNFYKNFTDSIAAPCYRSNCVIYKLSAHLCYSFDSIERSVNWAIACRRITICFLSVSQAR